MPNGHWRMPTSDPEPPSKCSASWTARSRESPRQQLKSTQKWLIRTFVFWRFLHYSLGSFASSDMNGQIAEKDDSTHETLEEFKEYTLRRLDSLGESPSVSYFKYFRTKCSLSFNTLVALMQINAKLEVIHRTNGSKTYKWTSVRHDCLGLPPRKKQRTLPSTAEAAKTLLSLSRKDWTDYRKIR